MKNLITVILLSLTFSLNAQENIKKILGEFSDVKVYDLINLKMIKANKNKVVISGENKDHVQIINKNGKLKIRLKLEESYDGKNTEVTLYYTDVDVIDANEGAKVFVEDVIKQFEIELKVQEGAEITAKAKTTIANIRAVTGGIINLEGKSTKQNISIFTGGVFNGEDFVTENTSISINAAGEASVHATEEAKIRIKAGGDVYLYGDPKTVDKKRVLGGRIKKM